MKVLRMKKTNKLIIGVVFSTILILNLQVYAAKISIGGPSKFQVGQTKRFIVVNAANPNDWNVETENNNGIISAKKKNRTTIECKGLKAGTVKLVVKDNKTEEKTSLTITITSNNNIISNSVSTEKKTAETKAITSEAKNNSSKTSTKAETTSSSGASKNTSTSGKSSTSTTNTTTTKSTKSTTVSAEQSEVVLGFSKSLKITNISNWTYEQAKDGRLQVIRSGHT